MRYVAALALFVVLGVSLAMRGGGSGTAAAPKPVSCPGCWKPQLRTTWQWQLSGQVDPSVPADVYDVDVTTPASVVADLHARGRRVVCYVSAGAWEEGRPDADRFPRPLLGRPNGWRGERWIDVRRLDVLRPLLRARIDACRAGGFDGIEFDNVDGYANRTGFSISAADQLRFNAWLANEAHRAGLAAALKNDLGQARELVRYFDFAIVEQCLEYRECALTRPFSATGKAVLAAEYRPLTPQLCARARRLGLSVIEKRVRLDEWRRRC